MNSINQYCTLRFSNIETFLKVYFIRRSTIVNLLNFIQYIISDHINKFKSSSCSCRFMKNLSILIKCKNTCISLNSLNKR